MADAGLRVIEIHAGETVFYVYREGVHIELRGADAVAGQADIGPRGMEALVNAWRKLHPDDESEA